MVTLGWAWTWGRYCRILVPSLTVAPGTSQRPTFFSLWDTHGVQGDVCGLAVPFSGWCSLGRAGCGQGGET